ncbi:formylglycine-generating enzyme family protein [Zoogloea sp.]|uniref:formylglycine-generating enzyme family protein n=1 Tax=Zoogloea sp. TaxID=49181 RepID=UPI0035B0885B
MATLESRHPPTFPPPWASAWGDDVYGLWADLSLPERTITQRLRWIPPGEFWMGSPDNEPERSDDEGPRHRVRLSRGYWLADTACSQAFWQAVMGDNNPSYFEYVRENPVENVSWDDVQGFLRKLESLVPDLAADLPTEAEWEYACRAGTETVFSWGNGITPEQANYDSNYVYADGPKGQYREKTVPVKSFKPNPWGLYQMHGNVWEWCADGQREYSPEAQLDPRGPAVSDEVWPVVCGGSWRNEPRRLRAAYRSQGFRVKRFDSLGFRFSLRSPGLEG